MKEIIQSPRDKVFTSGMESVVRSWQACVYDDDFLARVETEAERNGSELQRTSRKAVFLVEMPEGRFVVKKYWETQFFRYLFRPSPVLRELRGYRLAAKLKIPAARVVAVCERRRLARLKEDFIVTEFIEDSLSGNLLSRFGKRFSDAKLRNRYVQENIRRLARLHDVGYTHGGAHPRNFLWSGDAENLAIMWIDLATVRRHPRGITLREGMKGLEKHFLSKFDLSQGEKNQMHAFYCDSRRRLP